MPDGRCQIRSTQPTPSNSRWRRRNAMCAKRQNFALLCFPNSHYSNANWRYLLLNCPRYRPPPTTMKLPLHQTIFLSAAASSVDGFSSLSSHSPPTASALRTSADTSGIFGDAPTTVRRRPTPTRLYYEQPNDSTPPGTDTGSGEEVGIWTVLSNTEKWIAATLERSNRAAAPGRPAGQNPYSRKEVSYVCETVQDLPAVVASAFRRVKDARETGEAHGSEQEHILAERGSGYNPKTFRQTNVVVLPSCQGLDDFHTFDAMISAINTARRNARDYVTDVALEKLDDEMYGDGERDWVVSISLAHLHPDFGKKTSAEILDEMKKEDEEGEVDVNTEEYRELRNRARQSPYPSLVLEVSASPPPDFGNNKADASLSAEESKGDVNEISSADIKKLEQLFGQAATDHPVEEPKTANDLNAEEEAFWNSFGKLGGLEEISMVTPTSVASKWVAENDPSYDASKSTFVSGDLKMVDEAHEFAFSNIAMQRSNSKTSNATGGKVKELAPSKRSYLVLPNFLTSSATSFERFATEVSAIVDTIPGLSDEVSISTLHPETVEKEWRSPHPILILQFYDEPESD